MDPYSAGKIWPRVGEIRINKISTCGSSHVDTLVRNPYVMNDRMLWPHYLRRDLRISYKRFTNQNEV